MNSLPFSLIFNITFICLSLLFCLSYIMESIQAFPFCKVNVKETVTNNILCDKNQNQKINHDKFIDNIYTNETIRITSNSHNTSSIMYQEQNYKNYLENVINNSVNLTRSYQDQIALWNDHKYSNTTMAKITEDYLPKFISQLDQFNKTSAPTKYSKVKDNYVKSFDSEIKSYRLFDIYLKTNNSTANKLSTDYLSSALTFETIARNAFTAANNGSSGR